MNNQTCVQLDVITLFLQERGPVDKEGETGSESKHSLVNFFFPLVLPSRERERRFFNKTFAPWRITTSPLTKRAPRKREREPK